MKTVAEQFLAVAQEHPYASIVHHLGNDFSYQYVATRALNLAAGLQSLGLTSGDRVGILLDNRIEYVISYFAVQLAGGIVVALNPATTIRELNYTLVHSTPAVVIFGEKSRNAIETVAPKLAKLVAVICLDNRSKLAGIESVELRELLETKLFCDRPSLHLDHIAQIIYTSGTTGHPKGVSLTHRNLAANTESITHCLALSRRESVFVVLPFYYSYGNSLLLTHAALGGRLVLASDFVFWNRALKLMREQKATGFCGVPSTYAMLLHRSSFAKTDFPDLRYIACAGGALAPTAISRLQDCQPETEIYVMYGQTEATARLSILQPSDLPNKVGSIGRGVPGVSLQVLNDKCHATSSGEVGELYARGNNLMHGYWNDEAETRKVLTEHGLRTGDLAKVDDEGFIYIVGRRSDLIKTGAYRVNPEEIEEVILEIPGIAEVAVIGEPDELLGESIVAYVVKASEEAYDQVILDRCKQQLPPHKRVRRVEILDELPKTPSGKVKRSLLRQSHLNPPS